LGRRGGPERPLKEKSLKLRTTSGEKQRFYHSRRGPLNSREDTTGPKKGHLGVRGGYREGPGRRRWQKGKKNIGKASIVKGGSYAFCGSFDEGMGPVQTKNGNTGNSTRKVGGKEKEGWPFPKGG